MTIPAIYVHGVYADLIVSGEKTIETRTRDMLKRFVGQRVAVIRTSHPRQSEVVGEVTIERKAFESAQDLDLLRWRTLIPCGDKYDCKGGGKWCYYLKDAARHDKPVPLERYKIITRTRSFAILEEE